MNKQELARETFKQLVYAVQQSSKKKKCKKKKKNEIINKVYQNIIEMI